MEICALVIPVYKTTLNIFEKQSLSQARRVFQHIPIIFVAPIRLEFERTGQEKIIYFSVNFFETVQGYNDLLVSSQFYKCFLDFQYILIYQLDAFVFKTNITEWCNKKFSYIGAPWIYASYYESEVTKYKKMLLRFPPVGNGGLSLRKTKVHYLSARYLFTFRLRRIFKSYNEDWFWVTVIPKLNPWYKVADLETAKKFSIESSPEKSIHDLKGELPFGCHAWDKNYDYWKKFISLEN
ncbi:MAG: DUF5672 family protein [Saprospiraceae bacterium]